MKLSEIASHIGLTCSEDKEIKAINMLHKATDDELSFIVDSNYIEALKATQASAVIVPSKFEAFVPQTTTALVSDEPYLAFARLSQLFTKALFSSNDEPVVANSAFVHSSAVLGNGSRVGKNSTIMPNVVIGENVTIGNNCTIYPNVTIYNDTKIGNACIINAGSTIGSDGFGFAHTKTGEHVKIHHNGNVVLEDDVDIGANTTIDRGVFGSTLIQKGCKIDNLVQIAHNCEIGEYSIIVAQCGISGSTTLGRNVVMGGQSATAGHLKIGAFTQLAARSGVTKNIEGNQTYAGFPLMEHKRWLKLQAKISKLLKD